MAPFPSVLARCSTSQLRWDPFPHVVVPDALPEELCNALIERFPPLERVTGRGRWGSNRRFSLSARAALADPRLAPCWRDAILQHTSQAFLDEVLALLGPAIRMRYPGFEARFGRLEALRAGLRGVDGFDRCDVSLDAQICVNTPVFGRPSSVRTGHVDRSDKLFAGLLYLRRKDDASQGGDLQLYRLRPGGERGFNQNYIDDRWIEGVGSVAYERNVLVLLLNGPWALHGVTPRSPTPLPRLFLNLLGEVKAPLFDLSDSQLPMAGLRSAVRRGSRLVGRLGWPQVGA